MLQTEGGPLRSEYLQADAIENLHLSFLSDGYVRMPKLFTDYSLTVMRREIAALEPMKKRRKLIMPGYNTPRDMHTIGGSAIWEHSPLLVTMYEDLQFRGLLAAISGREIRSCSRKNEFMVVNFLENFGGTHGWHLDDPPFTLVVILEAPPAVAGGSLEFINSWRKVGSEMEMSEFSDTAPQLHALRTRGQIREAHHTAGDAYLLKADECLHRVTPLRSAAQRRVSLSFIFEDTSIPYYGETANLLYD